MLGCTRPPNVWRAKPDMTKLSAIVITKQHLRAIPDAERDVIWRFLTEHLHGINDTMTTRWDRWWRRLFKGDDDEAFMLYTEVGRSMKFHRRWMAIEGRIFANQDFFVNQDRFRDWLKTGAAWGEYHLGKDRYGADKMVFLPASIALEHASDDEMREFCEHAVEFLRSDRAQKRLWPHLTYPQRTDMLESLLADPRDQQ
jgi:hypothetical protein